MIRIQEINIPLDCKLIHNDFHTYDPVIAFKVADSIRYLNEDLLQCTFPEDNLIIDVGWYGEIVSNQGEFRIYIIEHENWEIPFNVIHSRSVEEIKSILIKVLQYYSKKEYQAETDNHDQ